MDRKLHHALQHEHGCMRAVALRLDQSIKCGTTFFILDSRCLVVGVWDAARSMVAVNKARLPAANAFACVCGHTWTCVAARNILVAADGACLMADFGLSRNLRGGEYCHIREDAALPIRWRP